MRGNLLSVYADLLLILALVLELHRACNQSKQRVILAKTNIVAGMNGSASLTDDNTAGVHLGTVGCFYAQPLGLTVTTVFGRTYALFVSEELQTES